MVWIFFISIQYFLQNPLSNWSQKKLYGSFESFLFVQIIFHFSSEMNSEIYLSGDFDATLRPEFWRVIVKGSSINNVSFNFGFYGPPPPSHCSQLILRSTLSNIGFLKTSYLLIHTSFLPSKWNLYLKLKLLAWKWWWKVVKKKYFCNSFMRKPFSSNSFYFRDFTKNYKFSNKMTFRIEGFQKKSLWCIYFHMI